MIGLWWARGVLAWLLWCGPAEPPSAVVVSLVVHTDHADEPARSTLEGHIVRELRLRGFRPTLAALGSAPSGEEKLEHPSVPRGALAVWVTVEADGLTTIVVARDAEPGVIKTSHRESPGPHMGSQLALLVAEPVEAWVARGGPEPPPEPALEPEADPKKLQPRPQPSRKARAALGADVGVWWPIRQSTPVGTAGVWLGYLPHRRVAILARSTLPMHAQVTRSDSGTVRTLPFVVGGLATIDVLPILAPARLDVEGGFSAVALRVDTDPSAGRRGRRTTAWMGAGHGGLRLRVPVRARVDLVGSATLLAPIDPVTLRTEGAAAQNWGPLWMRAALGVEARL